MPALVGVTKPIAPIGAALLCDYEKNDQHEYRAGDCQLYEKIHHDASPASLLRAAVDAQVSSGR
jgi:hypothetical protein